MYCSKAIKSSVLLRIIKIIKIIYYYNIWIPCVLTIMLLFETQIIVLYRAKTQSRRTWVLTSGALLRVFVPWSRPFFLGPVKATVPVRYLWLLCYCLKADSVDLPPNDLLHGYPDFSVSNFLFKFPLVTHFYKVSPNHLPILTYVSNFHFPFFLFGLFPNCQYLSWSQFKIMHLSNFTDCIYLLGKKQS